MADQNRMREVYEKWIQEVWAKGNVSIADEVLADDFVDHRPLPQYGPGRDGNKKMAADWHAAFPDLRVEIEDVIVSGDKLAARYSGQGTHRGGTLLGLPPTGQQVRFSEIDIVRFQGDKIAEWWHQEDVHHLLNQIQAAVATR